MTHEGPRCIAGGHAAASTLRVRERPRSVGGAERGRGPWVPVRSTGA
jgi:hypothetical protein